MNSMLLAIAALFALCAPKDPVPTSTGLLPTDVSVAFIQPSLGANVLGYAAGAAVVGVAVGYALPRDDPRSKPAPVPEPGPALITSVGLVSLVRRRNRK